MKMKTLSLACGLALAGMAGVASAEGVEFSGNVALTSDYVFRGISQNDQEPAIQGGFDAAYEGFYAGLWGSNVDEGWTSGSSMELDAYLGWGGDVGPVSLDVGALRYMYPGTSNDDNNTNEFHIGVSHDFGMLSAGLTANYSDDFYGADEAWYWDFGVEAPVGAFTIAAHYGVTEYDNDNLGTDYEDWSLGVSTEYVGFGFDLTYTDTDLDNNDQADESVAFTISKSL